jgi:hypothetical protein
MSTQDCVVASLLQLLTHRARYVLDAAVSHGTQSEMDVTVHDLVHAHRFAFHHDRKWGDAGLRSLFARWRTHDLSLSSNSTWCNVTAQAVHYADVGRLSTTHNPVGKDEACICDVCSQWWDDLQPTDESDNPLVRAFETGLKTMCK